MSTENLEAGPSNVPFDIMAAERTHDTRRWNREDFYQASYRPFPEPGKALAGPSTLNPDTTAEELFGGLEQQRGWTREELYEASYRPMTIYGPREEYMSTGKGKGKSRAFDHEQTATIDENQGPFGEVEEEEVDDDLDITADLLQRPVRPQDSFEDITAAISRRNSFDWVYEEALREETVTAPKFTSPPVAGTVRGRASMRWPFQEDIELEEFGQSRWSPSPERTKMKKNGMKNWLSRWFGWKQND